MAAGREWLSSLPGSLDLHLSGRLVRMVHASPVDEFTRVHREHGQEQFAMMFAPTPFTGGGRAADVVVYGDIHDPFLRSGREGTLVNVGSVGNQLDDPTPSYVILEGEADGGAQAPFGIQFVRVAYDVEAEIEATLALGMPETEAYVLELRSCRARAQPRSAGGLTAPVRSTPRCRTSSPRASGPSPARPRCRSRSRCRSGHGRTPGTRR